MTAHALESEGTRREDVGGLLRQVHSKGVELWAERGELHFRAPKGVLTAEEIQRLKAAKSAVVAFLEAASGGPANEASSRPDKDERCLPLAFTQLAHFNLYRLDRRSAIRQIALALHLEGPLKISVLRASLTEVVRRHDSLRAQVLIENGLPVQRVRSSVDVQLDIQDLTGVDGDEREGRVRHLIEEQILQPVNIANDPLVAFRLIKLDEQEHVLVIAMEHMISDMFSLGVLQRDLFDAYARAVRGDAVCVPEAVFQFSEYVRWQRTVLRPTLSKKLNVWQELLSRQPKLKFPGDKGIHAAGRGWATVPIHVSGELRARLQGWSRRHQTTLAMAVFTAFAALLLRSCGTSRAVIQYQSDGRASAGTQQTVGYFAHALYVCVELRQADMFVDLLARTTEAYCEAYERADSSYFEAQQPRPDFTCTAGFNWIPQELPSHLAQVGNPRESITVRSIPFEHPMLRTLERDTEPVLLLDDDGCKIHGRLTFARERYPKDVMERLGSNLLLILEQLPSGAEQRRIVDIEIE